MGKIEQNILDAMDILLDRAMEKADFDKTIKAVVVECVDKPSGRYKVKYQDSLYYATSDNIETTYIKNAEVYVLVPGGNFSAEKKIIGSVRTLGTNYVNVIEDDEAYEYIGSNIINNSDEIQLISYKTEERVLYSAGSENNILDIDVDGMKEYLTKSTHIIVGGQIRTTLKKEQQNYGNYGLIFSLAFQNDTVEDESAEIIRDYVLDVDNMIGRPYNYKNYSHQIEKFEINPDTFKEIRKITAFTKGFPFQNEEETTPDIFIKNIEISGALQLDPAALDAYYLSIITPRGTFFPKNEEGLKGKDTLSLEAEIKIKGKVIDNDSHHLEFYWFREHSGVDTSHPKYNKYGGQGWECLNDFILIEGVKDENGEVLSEDRYEWTPGKDSYTVKKEDCLALKTNYKCVCIYNDGGNIQMSKEITIKNMNAERNITIESSGGTEFVYDQGYTTLTCVVEDLDNSENLSYNYYWSKKNGLGKNYEKLPNSTIQENNNNYELIQELKIKIEDKKDSNEVYETQGDEYTVVEDVIKNRLAYKIEDQEKITFAQFYKGIESYEKDNSITRLEDNIIYNIPAISITEGYSTYTCSVFLVVNDGESEIESFIGSANIVLTNSHEEQPRYTLLIHNGTQAFKYNESGVSPTHESNEFPVIPQTLSFTLFDEKGNEVNESAIRRKAKVKWKIPADETMLVSKIREEDDKPVEEDGYKIYTNTLYFAFDLQDTYNINRNRNNIELEVEYQNKTIRAETNFVIVKEGEAGTNGTDVICRIVPNVKEGDIAPALPVGIYKNNGSGSFKLNYNPIDDKPFKLIVWKVTEEGVERIDEGVSVVWSVLKNSYHYIDTDNKTKSKPNESNYSINETTGKLSFQYMDYFGENQPAPANIIKASVKIANDDKQYYATLPITTVILGTGYENYDTTNIEGGYFSVLYNSTGERPQYDSTNTFDLALSSEIEGATYEWSVRGGNEGGTNLPKGTDFLTIFKGQGTTSCKVRPVDNYEGYEVNIALQLDIKVEGVSVITIHKPIHFLLNRYGLANLNDWDGNSIQVKDKEGYILSPQVGAGEKNADNTFTGILMGKVKETDSTETTGLIGYANGVRSFILNANDGSATFGTEKSGSIEIIPGSDSAIIKSGNYGTKENDKIKGMRIDLSKPEIRFASGYFVVDEFGNLHATSGTIGGWSIGDNSLTSLDNKVGMSSDAGVVFWAGNKDKNHAPFRVNYEGRLVSTSGNIAGFEIDDQYIQKTTSTVNLGMGTHPEWAFWAGNKVAYNNVTGEYEGSSNIKDAAFRVTQKGALYATEGEISGNIKIGGKLNANQLYLGDTLLKWTPINFVTDITDVTVKQVKDSVKLGSNSDVEASVVVGLNADGSVMRNTLNYAKVTKVSISYNVGSAQIVGYSSGGSYTKESS